MVERQIFRSEAWFELSPNKIKRSTPKQFEALKNIEDAFDGAAEEAKVTWTQVLCGKISLFNSAQELCETLNKLSSYQKYNSGGVCHWNMKMERQLFTEKNSVLHKKGFILVENFLMIVRLKSSSQRRWKRLYKIMRIRLKMIYQKKSREELNDCNEFLNNENSFAEVEAALQLLNRYHDPGSYRPRVIDLLVWPAAYVSPWKELWCTYHINFQNI